MAHLETRRMTTLAFLSAVGIALFVLESFIPIPFPFFKIGLANVSSLVSLILFGRLSMLLVVITRVIAGSFLTGSLFTPSFILGLSGGVVSAFVMALAASLGPRVFSVIGISLIGSVAHVVTQLIVVMLLFVQNESLVILLPLLLTSAIVGGLIVGWLSSRMIAIMRTEQGSLSG